MTLYVRINVKTLETICSNRGLGTDYAMFYGSSGCLYNLPRDNILRQKGCPFKQVFNYRIATQRIYTYRDTPSDKERQFPVLFTRASESTARDADHLTRRQCKEGATKYTLENIRRENDHLLPQPLFNIIDIDNNPHPITAENAVSKTKEVATRAGVKKTNELVTHSELRRIYKHHLDPRTKEMTDRSVVFLKMTRKEGNQIENLAEKEFVASEEELPDNADGSRPADKYLEIDFEEIPAPWMNSDGTENLAWKDEWAKRKEQSKSVPKVHSRQKAEDIFFENEKEKMKAKESAST